MFSKFAFLTTCLMAVTSSVFGQSAKELFDGKTLNGWEVHGAASWVVKLSLIHI